MYINFILSAISLWAILGKNSQLLEPANPVTPVVNVRANVPVADVLYNVDVNKSTLTWAAKAVAGGHSGQLKLAKGTLNVAGTKLTGGQFSIDMNSLSNTDISDAEDRARLIKHLKAKDFFGTAQFPTAGFVVRQVVAKGKNQVMITGNLTIKDATHPVSFPATVSVTNGIVQATGQLAIDRTKFGVRYGSPSFFTNLGDEAIDDIFTVDVHIVAVK